MSSVIDTSRPVASAPRVRKRGRRPIVVGVVVVAALAFLLAKGLDNATVYFRTADEAIAQRQALEGKRFRLEGTVVPGSIVANGAVVDFTVASKGVNVAVQNQGQPLGIFQENIPVVLEGKFASGANTFLSDRIMVRHSADYTAKYPDRVNGNSNK